MNNSSITLKLNLRIVCIVLLVIIAGMLAAWRPWQQNATATTRKITISGEATVKATPDEFVFYPSFQRTGADIASLKNELNAFGTKLQADLIKLGVAKSDIKLDSSSYDTYMMDAAPGSANGNQSITLQATITTPTQTLAQKVQDYLANTDAKGQLTAQPQFSTAKQKDLENNARQLAIADARKKAGQTASGLDANLGKVLEVTDQSGYYGGCGRGMLCPLASGAAKADTVSSLPVTPGTNEVSATVEVVFALQ